MTSEKYDGEVLQRLTRLETKMDMIISVKDTAFEALQSTKSAHKRIDDIEQNIQQSLDDMEARQQDYQKKIDKIIFWAATTIIGGVMLGSIGLLFASVQN